MSDLNVTTIQNNNIAKTDKLLAFNNSDSKAASIQDVVQLVPGKMAVATCSTAGNVATKAVTCADWTNKPGLSILVEFSNENSANNISLSINNGTAIPVYYMNTATEQVSGAAIPAGAVVFTLNAAGNKFYAHVTKLIEGAGVKIDGSKIEAVNDLPSDAVLHYSFDDLPDYPDGTADVRLLDNNTYDIQSTNYRFIDNGGATSSNENGNIKINIVGGASTGMNISIFYLENKIVKFRLNVTSLVGRIQIENGLGNVIRYIDTVGVFDICYLHKNDVSQYRSLYIFCNGAGNSCTFTVEQIYIGNGSYSTPVIDNANGQNNATNNGGIATKGVSGKGVRTFGNIAQPLYKETPSIIGDITVSVWAINYGGAGAYSLIASDQSISNLNWRINYNNPSGSTVIAKIGETYTSAINIETNVIHHFVLTVNGTSAKFYVDSVLADTKTVSGRGANNIIKLCGDSIDNGYRLNGMIDDLLIFDRALTEKEVVALYNNKANTPKYFSKADYLLEQIANNS